MLPLFFKVRMSNKLNLELKQGEDFYRLITIKDENSNPLNLTGFTFTSQVRATYSADLFLSFSFTILNQGTNAGQVEMKLAKTLSSAKSLVGKSNYVYDVEMNSGSLTSRIMEGTLKISPEVTR